MFVRLHICVRLPQPTKKGIGRPTFTQKKKERKTYTPFFVSREEEKRKKKERL
jgi:hypothetical protein